MTINAQPSSPTGSVPGGVKNPQNPPPGPKSPKNPGPGPHSPKKAT